MVLYVEALYLLSGQIFVQSYVVMADSTILMDHYDSMWVSRYSFLIFTLNQLYGSSFDLFHVNMVASYSSLHPVTWPFLSFHITCSRGPGLCFFHDILTWPLNEASIKMRLWLLTLYLAAASSNIYSSQLEAASFSIFFAKHIALSYNTMSV